MTKNKFSFNSLLKEKCPICGTPMVLKESKDNKAVYGKECPTGHYCREFHPMAQVVIQKNNVCEVRGDNSL